MKATLHNITRLCLYATLFIPLLVTSPLFFPFITGKNFIFRTLVTIALASWAVLMLRYSEFRPKKSWILWSFVIFTGLIGISDFFAINGIKAFWSNFERMEGYITILYLLVLFIVASSTFRTVKQWLTFFNVSFVAAWLIGLYGVLQLSGNATINQGGVRVDATLGNATYLAVYMLFHIFISLFLFLRARTENKKGLMWLYGIGTLFFTFIMLETATRGALLGVLAGLGLATLLVAIFEKKDRGLRKASIGLIIFGLVVVFGFIAIKNTPVIAKSPIFSRFASISLSEGGSRFMVWGMALKGVEEKPIFGWGQENFVYVFNKYYDPGMYAQEQWFDRTHNVFFDWAIAGGLLGLLAYLSLFGSVIWILWKAEGLSVSERAILTGLLLGYFVNNLFVFDNITSYLIFISIAAFAHTLGGKPIRKISLVETEVSDMTMSRLAVPAAILGCAVVFYFSVYRGVEASLNLIDGLRYTGGYPTQDISKAIDSFKTAVSYGPLGRTEVRERIVESVAQVNSSSADIPVKQAFLDFGKAELTSELDQTKNDARIEFFTSIFYANYGLFDDALTHAQNALALSPTKQTLLYHTGSLLLKKGRVDEALALFKKAYEEKPENEDALKYYAVGAIYAGNMPLVESLLIPKYGTIAVASDDKFALAYMDTKQWNIAAQVWEARIKDSAGDPRNFYQLALVYVELGEKDKAIETLKKIETLEPKLTDQVEGFIKDVQAGKHLQ